MIPKPMVERHRTAHIGWLRAAVLGANDGILSTASLIVGVAAAQASQQDILISGAAGLVAGAMSMAAGEYVSVSSQSDTEQADLKREREEIAANAEFERDELASIYVERGVEPALAKQVAIQLMARDALGAHAREELGIYELTVARPVQAALTSAVAFALGGAMPLLLAILLPSPMVLSTVAGSSLVLLAILGLTAAKIGGADLYRGALRVTVWGAMAMLITAAIGGLVGRPM